VGLRVTDTVESALAHLALDNPLRVLLEYLANRELTERNEADVLARCGESEIPLSSVRIDTDHTGLSLLVTCQRHD